MMRAEILAEASRIVTAGRQDVYGRPEDLFAAIAALWSVHPGVSVGPVDVAVMMAQLKLARIIANPGHRDSWVDACGYLACGAELALPAASPEPAAETAVPLTNPAGPAAEPAPARSRPDYAPLVARVEAGESIVDVARAAGVGAQGLAGAVSGHRRKQRRIAGGPPEEARPEPQPEPAAEEPEAEAPGLPEPEDASPPVPAAAADDDVAESDDEDEFWTPQRDLTLVEGFTAGENSAKLAQRLSVPAAECVKRFRFLVPKRGWAEQQLLLKRLRAEVAEAAA